MKHCANTLVLALAIVASLATQCAAQSAEEYYNQALSRQRSGELRDAVRLYTKAIDADNHLIMAYQMRGAAWQKMRQYQQAYNDYTVLIERGEPYFRAVGYYNRGIVNAATRRYTFAISDFTEALKLDGKIGSAYFHRAVARLKSADSTGAFYDLHRAARRGDTDAERWLNLLSPGWRERK